MSAIFGIWNINGEPVEEKFLRKMEEKLRHYGRNARDIKIDNHIGLGCCLNKLSRYAETEVPVFQDEARGITLVGDALIYNRDELIGKYGLAGSDDSSTQALLLAAYQKWGGDCAKYINGDFAFAVWEKSHKQLLLVRDHLGVRPLYYFYNGSTLAFATDYRALLALAFVGKQPDEVKLYAELSNTYHIDPEAIYFAQIKRLPQAHTLRVDATGILKTKYWSPGAGLKISLATEAAYQQAMYDLVADAIKRRVHSSDLQIGSELSGGLDSSVITVLANRELRGQGVKMPLFSWSPPFEVYERQPRDEREFIEDLCRKEGLECIYYDPEKYSDHEELSGAVLTDGGDGSVFRHELQELTARGVKLILTGWGGDQGISHRTNLKELFFHGDWGYFLKEARYLAKGSLLRFIKVILSNTVMTFFGPFSYFDNSRQGQPRLVRREFARKMKRRCKRDILYFTVDPVKHLEFGNIQTRTELAAWVDAEYNVQHLFPYLDYRVVDFAMSIPRRLYYHHGMNRYLFRKAFESLLPEQLCYYTYKDDIARCTYFSGTTNKSYETTKNTAKLLDRDLFSSYIDWDKLEKMVDSPECLEDLKTNYLLSRKIQVCFFLQRIIAETEKTGG
jgi:asparagine synthase (glutamine-hydrolysing)